MTPLPRRNFLRALICAPFAAKAVERIIANGVTPPAPKIEPVKPTVEPVYERAYKEIDWSKMACSGTFSQVYVTGYNDAWMASGTCSDKA